MDSVSLFNAGLLEMTHGSMRAYAPLRRTARRVGSFTTYTLTTIMSDSKNQKETKQNEPTFGILPHPAKTNNPADLNRPRAGEEMPSVGDRMSQLASSGPGPHIMSDKQKTGVVDARGIEKACSGIEPVDTYVNNELCL